MISWFKIFVVIAITKSICMSLMSINFNVDYYQKFICNQIVI